MVLDYDELKKSVDGTEGDWYADYYTKRRNRRIMVGILLILSIALLAWIVFLREPADTPGGAKNNSVAVNETEYVYGNASVDYTGLDFSDGLMKSLEGYGTYYLRTGLPEDECFLLGVSWDEKDYYLHIDLMTACDGTCSSYSEIIDSDDIKTIAPVNIRSPKGRNCFCGDKNLSVELRGVQYKGEITSIIFDVQSVGEKNDI